MSIFSRHTAYERLVTEHVDGVLDTAGEARLQQHLATCESCVVEMREQQAVRSLLRTEALVPTPRSFALPYAPRQAAGDSRVTAWLRPMQVATATAAVVLVALVVLFMVATGIFIYLFFVSRRKSNDLERQAIAVRAAMVEEKLAGNKRTQPEMPM